MQRLKTDVVILGTGGAGMAAAISAAEGGAQVVVFEKRRNFGGISVTGMGIFAVESRLQKLKNVPFTREQVFKLFMERTHWMADARLVRAYIDKTASTIEWLEGMGVRFDLLDITTFPGCLNQTGHIVRAPRGGWHGGISAHMIKLMKEHAEKLGVKFYFATPVKKIVKTGRRITGVVAADKGGRTLEVTAGAVIVAAGGYVHNREMLAKFGGFELGRDFHIMHTIRLEGDGIQMAWAVGAVPDGMYPQLAGIGVAAGQLEHVEKAKRTTFIGRPHPSINTTSRQPYLWVNLHGMRFVDEGCGNGPYMANALVRQKDRVCFTIIDSDTKRHLQGTGVESVTYMDTDSPKIGDLDADIKSALTEGLDYACVADSIKALAAKIKVDASVLQHTIDEYNRFCDKGHDDLFAKDPRFLRPVRKPPFYAFRRSPSGYGTIGGIKINEKTEAMGQDNEAIPGLYAAGDCANGTHTYDYPLVYILWGSTLGFAINSGRIAGENAAKYIQSVK